MDFKTDFSFEETIYSCTYVIDSDPEPCYIFVVLNNHDLIKRFGEEVTIKTDFVTSLSRRNDYQQLTALRQSIFTGISITPQFSAFRRRSLLTGKWPEKKQVHY